MESKSFTFTSSMYVLFNLIPKWRLNKFIRKIVEYGINGTEPKRLNKTERTVFETIKRQMVAEKQLSKVRSYAGKKGGAPKNNQNASKSQDFTTKQAKTSKNKYKTSKNKQNITTIINKPNNYRPKFTKTQMELFCISREIEVDIDAVYSYCVKNNVTDWRPVVIQWGM